MNNHNAENADFSPETLRHKHFLTDDEAKELSELLLFFQSKNYHTSKQVSDCIRANKLGNKFPNLSGILTMKNASDSWKFEGGIAPKFYAIVCSYLSLSGQNSDAKPVDFTPYKNIGNAQQNVVTQENVTPIRTATVTAFNNCDDDYYFTTEDWVEFYGGDPSDMSAEEMESFIESQEPDFD